MIRIRRHYVVAPSLSSGIWVWAAFRGPTAKHPFCAAVHFDTLIGALQRRIVKDAVRKAEQQARLAQKQARWRAQA